MAVVLWLAKVFVRASALFAPTALDLECDALFAEHLFRIEPIVGPASNAKVAGIVGTPKRLRHHMIELEQGARVAAPAAR